MFFMTSPSHVIKSAQDLWTKSFSEHEKSEEWVGEVLGIKASELASDTDKALATKVSWWFKYYVNPILALDGELRYLKLQFGIVIVMSSIEAVLGGGGKPAWKPIYDFLQENLSDADQNAIAEGIEWSDKRNHTLEETIKELVARRNALLHGLYLPNLNEAENSFTVTYSQYEYAINKGHVGIRIKITAEEIAAKTRDAIVNHFSKATK